MITQAFALGVYDAGLAVVPVRRDGSKGPATKWKALNEAGGPTRAQVEAWYAAPQPGIGLLCGPASGGLEMLELEARAVEDGLWKALTTEADRVGLGGVLTRIARLYLERSPSGGLHLLYRVSGMDVPGNTKLALNEAGDVLMETRGTGGFVVVAPSNGPCHPSGQPWECLSGDLTRIGTITAEQHQALWAICRGFNRLHQVDEAPIDTGRRSTGLEVAPTAENLFNPAGPRWMDAEVERFNADHSWDEVLGNAGWVRNHTDSAGITYWTRPGKDPRAGHSATTNARGTDRLTVFTSAEVGGFVPWDGSGPATTYDRFAAWAILTHGGDRTAAARSTRAQSQHLVALEPPESTAEAAEARGVPDGFNRLTGALLDEEDAGGDWLIEPVVAAGRGHALYAKAKTGKSLLMDWLVTSAAAGRATLSRPAGEPVRTLYCDFEQSRADVRDRWEDMGLDATSAGALLNDDGPLAYCLFPRVGMLDTPEGGLTLVGAAEAHRADLVVIDTTSRVISTPEKDPEGIQRFFTYVGTPLKARGIAWVRIDHEGKDSTLGQRGSSAKNEDVDIVWNLGPSDRGRLALTATHQRSGWVEGKVVLERHTDPLRYEQVDEDWPIGTKAVADRMTALGLPLDLSRRKAEAALRAVGEGVSHEVVLAAMRWRRREATSTLGRLLEGP